MTFFALLRILFILWGAGLVGRGALLEELAADGKAGSAVEAMRGTWFGLNQIPIGLAIILGVLVWHFWSKAPAGSTFKQKLVFVLQQILSYPKRVLNDLYLFWKGIPTA